MLKIILPSFHINGTLSQRVKWNHFDNEYTEKKAENLGHSNKHKREKEMNIKSGNVDMDSNIDNSHLSGVKTDVWLNWDQKIIIEP